MFVPPHRPLPETHSIRKAMSIINDAKKPILIVGGGVRWSKAGDLVDELSKKLKIPVATSLNGKDVIDATNPLNVGVVGTYSRASANKSVLAADLAIFIGTDLGGMITNFGLSQKLELKQFILILIQKSWGETIHLKLELWLMQEWHFRK